MILRRSFAKGWVPTADHINGPRDGLLRMDNCILDEEGILSLRPGSLQIYDFGAARDCHSIFQAVIGTSRYTCVGLDNDGGAGTSIYVNGARRAGNGFDGVIIPPPDDVNADPDISFGSYMGYILAARSTYKTKLDGTTTRRNWGITAPVNPVTLTAIDPQVNILSDFGSGWVGDEGSVAQAKGQDDVANGALAATPDSASGRGSITVTYGADQDFSAYADGDTSVDQDVLSFYGAVQEPNALTDVTVMVDVGTGTPFSDDVISFTFTPGIDVTVELPKARKLAHNYNLEGFDRDSFLADDERRGGPTWKNRRDRSAGTIPQWSLFQVSRGQMSRSGNTPGRGWNTVRAVKIVFNNVVAQGSTVGSITFDTLKMTGGSKNTLTGNYTARAVLVYNSGRYVGKSAPSPVSAEIALKNNGLTVSIDIGGHDDQVNEVWFYLMGGTVNAFYRYAVRPGIVHGSTNPTMRILLSDLDASEQNIVMETDNLGPPDNIIGIAGPHHSRIFTLTSDGKVWPSRQLNPDSFSAGQAVQVSDPVSETPYWLRLINDALCVGTNKDIYRLEGSGAERPDKSIDFLWRPLHIEAPISRMVAQDGSGVVQYLAADGFREFNGYASQRLGGQIDTLVKGIGDVTGGKTFRHGVQALNFGATFSSLPGRFRAVISNKQLISVVDEAGLGGTAGSPVMYRYDYRHGVWYRHTYTKSWRSIYRAPDGKLFVGSDSGQVWWLDCATSVSAGDTKLDGALLQIPVELAWVLDDFDQPQAFKDPYDFEVKADTGGDVLTSNLYTDYAYAAGAVVAQSIAGSTTNTGADKSLQIRSAITGLFKSRYVQVKMTGLFTRLKLYYWLVNFRERPASRMFWDTGYVDLGNGDYTWLGRRLFVKTTAPVALKVSVYIDGLLKTSQTIPAVTTDGPQPFTVYLPGGLKGNQGRVTLEPVTPNGTATAFEPYWLRFTFAETGGQTDKKQLTVKAA